jgi:membrane glycosyltransferase
MEISVKSLRRVAQRRRLILAAITFFFVFLIGLPLGRMLAHGGWTGLKIAFLALSLFLIAQLVFSSIVAAVGWWLITFRPDPLKITHLIEVNPEDIALPATAIVMPIFNEDVNRVFQGIRAMYQSLQQTGHGESFDFFILSDTNDTNHWIAEEKAWFDLCKELQAFGRIFYRKRRLQLHHKSGNIADFCRRWGAKYRYMIVLDADSVMTGPTFVRLAALMEKRPWVGILQTMTKPILGESLFQRIDQFAAYAYRPIFVAGAGFWQSGDSTFWGHNAIIRLKPFIDHCAMPQLPEFGPLGRQILSHDTIEAALMRRCGYEVWQANDLPGSYEEGPPHLLASLKRDRRWCHGNLQHVWFLFERGIRLVSRYNILTGILAYANSPLWFLSLILGVLVITHAPRGGTPAGSADVVGGGLLYAGVMLLLFLPKILGAVVLMRSPDATRLFGSRIKAAANVALETLYSMVMAPILMLFYTRFVLASLCGIKVGWGPQLRSDEDGPPWREWVRLHATNFLFAAAVTIWAIHYHPHLALWLTPVLVGPLVAMPFSRWSASPKRGRRARAGKWFVTPEEVAPPAELQKLEEPFIGAAQPLFLTKEYASDYGLLQAILDPYVNAIHVSFLRQRSESGARTKEYLGMLADRLLLDGPFTLTLAEKRSLLWDAEAMLAMHHKLWGSPSSHLHEWWQAAFRNYVETSALSARRTVSV